MEAFTLTKALMEYFENEGYENYQKVRSLTDEESKNDPENDPFKSKYRARELLQEMLSKVHKEREEDVCDTTMRVMEAALQYYLGINYIQTEERPGGEECLERAIELIDKNMRLSQQAISIVTSVYSELGILWANRYQGHDKALSHLNTVESLYNDYKHDVGLPPFGVDESLKPMNAQLTDLQRDAQLEKIYTHALFYLAQVHKHSENNDLSAKYCQQTLRRQLQADEYDPKDWAVNAAGLSQYYICRNMYQEAKHCLSCANVIMDEAKPPEGLSAVSPEDDAETLAMKNAIPQRKADIARCWVKYFLALLDYSKERLSNDVYELDVARQADALRQLGHSEDTEGDVPKNHVRMPIEVDSVEEQVRHLPVATFEESREVFLICKRYVENALEFFILDGYVTDNIELTQDLSTLYKHILFFERNKDRKCKMHKRRVDLLSHVLEEINPKFYLLICRQLQFELGEIYSDMVDLKTAISNESQQGPTNHAVKKINSLCRSGILYFKRFVETLKDLRKVLPNTLDEDVERPAIVAHFYLARLHSKILAPVRSEKLSFLKQSLEFYQWIVDYVDRNPKCEPNVQKEVEICREMVQLLPKSMERYME